MVAVSPSVSTLSAANPAGARNAGRKPRIALIPLPNPKPCKRPIPSNVSQTHFWTPIDTRARRGEGPTLIEVETYRYYGHFQGDPETYRPKGEVASLKAMDPIRRLREAMIAGGEVSEVDADAAQARAKARVDEAFAFARTAPDPVPEDALTHVFA